MIRTVSNERRKPQTNQTTFDEMIKRFEAVFQDPEPYVIRVLRQIISGKLDNKMIRHADERNPIKRPNGIIVFVFGGITLEESCLIQKINKEVERINVISGGSKILTTDSFIEQLQAEIVGESLGFSQKEKKDDERER